MRNFKDIRKQRGFVAYAVLAGAASLYYGHQAAQAAEEQAEAQQEALAAQKRSAEVESQKARLQQVRESRIARARILAQASNVGLGAGTSGVSGAMSSITSQAASNIGTINQMQTFSDIASRANQRIAALSGDIAQYQFQGAAWQAVGQGAVAWGKIKTDLPEVQKAEARFPPSKKTNTSMFG